MVEVNREDLREYDRIRRLAFPEITRAHNYPYYRKNRVKICAQRCKNYRENREEKRALARQYRRANPEKVRAWRRKSNYGITPEQFAELLRSQRGRCPICRVKIDGAAHVDHDHKTGKVRGLLCNNCNFGIGLMKDNYRVVQNAADYLRPKTKSNPPSAAGGS